MNITMTIDVPQKHTVFILNKILTQRDVQLKVGYYPGEDVTGGTTYKIEAVTKEVIDSIQQMIEISLTPGEFLKLTRFMLSLSNRHNLK